MPILQPRHPCLLALTAVSLLVGHASAFDSPNIPIEQLTCRPTGLIQDTSCDYETVDEVNRNLHSALSDAVQLPIFRYHKVDLYRQCPFWSDDGLCGNRACAVDELDRDDVPAYWRTSELSDLKTTDADELPIDLANKCVVKEQDYCVLDDDSSGVPSSKNGVYVDLLANPERFTGYAGKSAQRVWRAIYEENCFNAPPRPPSSPFGVPLPSAYAGLETKPEGAMEDGRNAESCLEKRVYYKLLSGLHTSISMHICDEYLDPTTGRWVPNLQCYLNRIGLYPERLKNLYFAYTLMLRALSRSASYLSSPRVELCTGDAAVDAQTRRVLDRLISTAHAYPVTFDETSMFKGESAKQLKGEFKAHFRNVSRIMDCVGCDKCRLWGKLQFMGLGTGLKLLFEYEEGNSHDVGFHLTRPELIAFINTLNRLSESLVAVEKFRKLWQQRADEGTLPVRVADEKLDALASGRAAKAIALSPGLGPRANLAWQGVAPAGVEDKAAKMAKKEVASAPAAEVAMPAKVTVVEKHNLTQMATTTGKKMARPSGKPYLSASQKHNQSDTAVHRRNSHSKYQIVDLGILSRPASRFVRLFSERCKNSVVVCAHWLEELVGQVKSTIWVVSRSRHHDHGHEEDGPTAGANEREKEL